MKLMTRQELAEEFGVSYQWMSVIARRDGFPLPERKQATVMQVSDECASFIGIVKRPAWLYDLDKVKAFMDSARPSPKSNQDGEERNIPCGQCGEIFTQRLNTEHWYCSRRCKEKAKRERNRLKTQKYGKVRNINK